jgi:hypothetical protein
LVFVSFAASSPSSADESLTLTAEFVSALHEVDNSFASLTALTDAASAALAGHAPKFNADWGKLAEAYEKAAADAKAAPLPSSVKPASNVVTVADLTHCSTRQASIATLTGNLVDLQNTQQKGQNQLSELDKQLANVEAARDKLRYLLDVQYKLIDLPVVGEHFSLDWTDLDTRVRASLGELESVLTKQHQQLVTNLDLLKPRIHNYQSNLTFVKRMPRCSPIAGAWQGAGSSATVQVSGRDYCSYRTTINDVHLSVSVNGRGQLTAGTVTAVMDESLVGNCSFAPAGTRNHSYALARGSSNNRNVLAEFTAISSNSPKCSARFDGSVINGRLVGTLKFHRIDSNAHLNWTTQHRVQ